jgi:hypothetical protein
MSALMNKESRSSFSLAPKSIEEAEKFAEIFCKSELCPKHLKGKPGDVLMTMQMGYELGLEPLQAIKTIGVINGIPFAYGDGKLALIMKSPFFEDMVEWLDENNQGNVTAYCKVKRKGRSELTRSFSMSDAKTAGLTGKQGPWQQYPKRMLQHRARGLALSDTFADVLFGLVSEEEAREMASMVQEKNITPVTKKGTDGVREALGITHKQSEPIHITEVSETETVEMSLIEDNSNYSRSESDSTELATGHQLEDIHALIIKYGISDKMVKRWFDRAKVTSFENMKRADIQACIDFIVNKASGVK